MLGFSQITRTSVAVSAPGDGDADGYDRPVAGLRRLTATDPGTPAKRGDRMSGSPRLIRHRSSGEA
jgi:hypothetical protein